MRAAGERISGKETLDRVGSEHMVVRLSAIYLVMPMRAAGEVPTGIRAEIMKVVDLVKARRSE